MVAFPTKQILIVPDFGVSVDNEAMVALYKAIHEKNGFTSKIIDLRQMVVDEHPGETLTEPEIIDLSARKLEQLASDVTILWEYAYEDDKYRTPWQDIPDKAYTGHGDIPPEEVARKNLLIMEEMKQIRHIRLKTRKVPVQENPVEEAPFKKSAGFPQLRITKSITPPEERYIGYASAPDILVLLGKSAMLAGGIKDRPILFINPRYDAEWPWEKQYKADREAADGFYAAFIKRSGLDDPQRMLAIAFDDSYEPRWEQPERLGLFTEESGIEEFAHRYPRLAMSDPELQDTDRLVEDICRFTKGTDSFQGKTDTPRFDIERMLFMLEPPKDSPLTVTLPAPVELHDGRKITNLQVDDPQLDSIYDCRDLRTIRVALRQAIWRMPKRKKILIVPDLLTPWPSPAAEALCSELRTFGYYVQIMQRYGSLKGSRKKLERRCRDFLLVITLGSGCLLTPFVTHTNTIFINPDWTAWKEMKRLGAPEEEWETARRLRMNHYTRPNSPCWTRGWFTADMADSDEAKEHIKRFGDAAFPPSISLTDEDGIRAIAQHINDLSPLTIP